MEAKRNPIDPVITWAPDYCKHCFTCIHICPVKNLKFKKDEMQSLGKCIQCRLCMKYCPDFALEVTPKSPPKAKSKTAPKVKTKSQKEKRTKPHAGSGTRAKTRARSKESRKAGVGTTV
jgi:ferredoxin